MIKIKSMEVEKDDNDIILKFYVEVRNKKRIAFAKELDAEYYENCFFVVESLIPIEDEIKFDNFDFELFYIGNMDYVPCSPKLNKLENLILTKYLLVRRKFIIKECKK